MPGLVVLPLEKSRLLARGRRLPKAEFIVVAPDTLPLVAGWRSNLPTAAFESRQPSPIEWSHA